MSYCVLVLTPYGHWKTQRRYSEFRVLDKALSKTFDDASASLPPFPSKKRLRADKNSDKFLNSRRTRLDIYLSAVCNTFSFQTAELAAFWTIQSPGARPATELSSSQAVGGLAMSMANCR